MAEYDLSKLGWKAFQDLACAVAAEVLQRPIQTFLPTNDAGRDGAFVGKWKQDGIDEKKSTIQCKFTEKAGAKLSLSQLTEELDKAEKLASKGLAADYVILTNADVTATSEAKICQAFEERGVGTCRVFSGTWIVEQIKSRPRLRMMVPRVYGIGDLSHFATAHAYSQAKAILENMGPDLGCFVPTASYKKAVGALNKTGFVIMLGDPASGKSTIAALLSLGSLDDGCIGAIRITNPEQLTLWHPGERQVLWVDDAFGSNQFDIARMQQWNANLGLLRTAVDAGARIIFTSRNYIWSAARPHLKISEFPLIGSSQVTIDIQKLTPDERAQILYNHVRRKQPKAMRRRLKPFLPAIAERSTFLPETARRLGNPIFTESLAVSLPRLQQIVDHPVDFLCEVLEQLDDSSRAAIALIFLHSDSGVPSPIPSGEALAMVVRLTGATPPQIAKALENLDDSLTRRLATEEGEHWIYRHPTISDAYAAIVAKSPELVELYVSGAKLERLTREVICKANAPKGAAVRVPASLYPVMYKRLAEVALDEGLRAFLGQRCDDKFLKDFVQIRPDILSWAAGIDMGRLPAGSQTLVVALHRAGILPELLRAKAVDSLIKNSLQWFETDLLEDDHLRQLFTASEFHAYGEQLYEEWIDDLDNAYDDFVTRFSSDDEANMFEEFKRNMKTAQRYFSERKEELEFEAFYQVVDEHISNLGPPDDEGHSSMPTWSSAADEDASSSGIFSDIDAE